MAAAEASLQSFLMNIPLELRYKIFEAATVRSNPPEHLFVHWFEKKEAADRVRDYVTANPGSRAPIVRYSKYKPELEPEFESEDEDGESEIEEDEDSEQDGEDEDMDDEDMEDEDDVEDEDEDEDEDEHEDEHEHEPEDEDMDDEIEQADEDNAHVVNTNTNEQQDAQIHTATAAGTTHENPSQSTSAIEAGHTPEATTEEQEGEGNSQNAQGDIDMADNGAHANTDTITDLTADSTTPQPAQIAQPAQPVAPPPPTFKPSPKWRHVAKFMKLTHSPPPIELLLTSKQLNQEAMSWYYEAAVLHIQATSGSLAHTTFFEEALNQIADAAFSPVENIRKVEVTFVWDSAWINAQENGDTLKSILPALVNERAKFIRGILKRAPALKELVIHWHDSLQDNDSTDMKLETLAMFLELPANVNAIEHYIEPDAKPYKKSIAGKFRMELQGHADRDFADFYA